MSDDTRSALREVKEYFRLPSVGLVEKDLYVIKAIEALAAIDAAPSRSFSAVARHLPARTMP